MNPLRLRSVLTSGSYSQNGYLLNSNLTFVNPALLETNFCSLPTPYFHNQFVNEYQAAISKLGNIESHYQLNIATQCSSPTSDENYNKAIQELIHSLILETRLFDFNDIFPFKTEKNIELSLNFIQYKNSFVFIKKIATKFEEEFYSFGLDIQATLYPPDDDDPSEFKIIINASEYPESLVNKIDEFRIGFYEEMENKDFSVFIFTDFKYSHPQLS
jgi:hypothetical protein